MLLCNPEEEVEYEYVLRSDRSGRAEEMLLMMMVLTYVVTLLLWVLWGMVWFLFWEGLGHAVGGMCVCVKGYGIVWYGKSL